MVHRQKLERVGETGERKTKESGKDAEAHSRMVQFPLFLDVRENTHFYFSWCSAELNEHIPMKVVVYDISPLEMENNGK